LLGFVVRLTVFFLTALLAVAFFVTARIRCLVAFFPPLFLAALLAVFAALLPAFFAATFLELALVAAFLFGPLLAFRVPFLFFVPFFVAIFSPLSVW
jgi:hypothetical protein